MIENLTEETNLIDLIINIYKTIVHRRKVIVSSFIAAFLLGFLYLQIKVPVYKTEMIVSSPVVTSERITFFIEPLSNLAKEKNIEELCRLLNIDSVTAMKIVDIEAKELKDITKSNKNENYDSEYLRQQNCLVSVKIKGSIAVSDTIQVGVIKYLKKNNFIQRRTEIEMGNLLNLKKRIKNEISELDSLKVNIFKNKGQYSLMDPSSINNSIANLYQQELNIDLKMKLDDGGVNIIRDFARYKSPIEPSKKLVLIFCLVFGFVLSYLSILVISVRERLKTQENS